MITRSGPRRWENVHFSARSDLADLLLVDNSASAGTPQPNGFAALQQASRDLDGLIQEARDKSIRIRALGAGWALSDIAVTDGWLVNTKALNGCFEVADRFFAAAYDPANRPFVILAQAGMSIAELNGYLEVTGGRPRAFHTTGIGAGQTIAGAFSGNTHGSAIKFGSTPDWVAGMQLVTGTGTSLWIERASKPVMNDDFVARLGARAVRDDDVFNAALVSFGSFGIITAVAMETAPIYHLAFPPLRDHDNASLKARLAELATTDFTDPNTPYHFEFVWDPYGQPGSIMETSALKVAYEPGHESPPPVWIVRNENGLAMGDKVAKILLESPLLSSKHKAEIQYREYRKRAILENVRGTPGQVFTATIFYFDGYTETAIGVSITDAGKTLDVATAVVRQLDQPCISQVRLVHPTKALLGFTCHAPKTAVFEFGLANNDQFPVFERALTQALRDAAVPYTFHWSKNSGIDNPELLRMYGADRVARWRAARELVFNHDASLMRVFENPQLVRAGLA
jgi:FAD/FMN-containing dehydrogenase